MGQSAAGAVCNKQMSTNPVPKCVFILNPFAINCAGRNAKFADFILAMDWIDGHFTGR